MAVKCSECPLYERKGDWTNGQDCDDVLHEEILKVWDNMVPIGAVEQIKWERDMAMQQLKEHGIPFCGVEDDVVKVVRCRECKFKPHWDEKTASAVFPIPDRCPCECDDYFYSWVPNDDWFCADGEKE